MAETKKKSQYNFGGHNFDAALYLLNLRDNAESFLNSKTDWTPEQKEEWKHSYTNFTNALLDLINNGTDRFSTDEFGTITDKNGEFSNTDSDNFYYNNNGLLISLEDYDKLKARKQGKYLTFEANRQFARYANLVGKGLRDALEAKKATSGNTEEFDYAKNGFASFWNKKYNPSGEQVDRKLYWALDKDGQYTNRIAQTLTDLDEYLKRDDLPDNVRANIEAYKNKLQEYSIDNKDFDVEGWKNGVLLAASRAGLGIWNNGFFNMGSQDSTASENKPEKTFDINNDLDVIDRYNLASDIAAHPELREHIIDLARRQYNLESLDYTDRYNEAIKLELEAKNNKIWQTYLANNPHIANVNKRIGRTGTTSFWSGARSIKKAQDYVSLTIMSQEEQNKVHNTPGYVGKLRPELQAALTGARWNTDENPLLQLLNISTTTGTNLKNLGNWYQYNWDLLMARRDTAMRGWTAVKDSAGNEVWKRNDSFRSKDGTYFYMFMGKNGKLYTYRSKPYSALKAELIAKGQLGMSIYTKQGAENARKLREAKAAISKLTALDKGRTAQLQKNMEKEAGFNSSTGFSGTDWARLASIGMDMGSLAAAWTGPETMGLGTLVSAGLGVGSTATNFAADLIDGENLGNALGSAATGIGMDVLGLIPGAGTTSKTGKIIKTAAKYATRLLAAYGAYLGVKNMPYIINSTKKLITPGAHMTVDDYRNIALGINLIVLGGAAVSRKIKNNKTTKLLEKQNIDFSDPKNKSILVKLSGLVALRFKDKQGNTKSFAFKGEDAKAIRNAKNVEEIKAITSKYGKLRNYELVNSKALRPHLLWVRKDGDWLSPIHRVDNPIRKYDVYENAGGMYTNLQGIRGWLSPYGGDVLNKSNILGVPRKAKLGKVKLVKASDSRIKLQVLNAVTERAANDNLLKDFQAASDLRRQAKNSGNIQDYHDAIVLLREAWNKLQGARTEYNKLRNMVTNGYITFGSGKNKVQADWKDILSKYRIAYKLGGSILKLAAGDNINGNPWYSLLRDYDVSKYEHDYDTNLLYAGDMSNGPTDFYVSNLNGQGTGRYAPTNNTVGLQVMDIENLDYYLKFGEDLLNEDGTFTPMGEKWAKAVDAQLPSDSPATFYDSNGKLRTKWVVENNDSLNRPATTYDKLADYVKRVRNDQILGARHNVFLNTGNRYFYKDKDGILHWVDPKDLKGYKKSDKPVTSGWNDDKTVYWNDYEITGATSDTNPSDDKKPEQTNDFSVKDLLSKLDVTDKWGIPRAMYADITNRNVTDMLKKLPLILDQQEDRRSIQSELDAEMNGQATAALLSRLASLSLTPDGNLQTAALIDAAVKGNEAITLGRQQSNLRLREMAELAWELEVTNHTSRHNTAMLNRLSIHNTKNENKALEAAYLNLKFTVWDALAQEKEFKAKSDYEQKRAKADYFAEGLINNAIKYGLSNYAEKYKLSPEEVSLWNLVYVDGSTKLADILKDPNKLAQWNKVLSITRQILQDLLGEYYGIPKSKYWTIRLGEWSPTTLTSGYKKGGHLNLSKVRAAAKGEKLAAALLKAQTADADRFYKTTKDHIDRMYDAINRLTNYSSTKKKRKKKSN